MAGVVAKRNRHCDLLKTEDFLSVSLSHRPWSTLTVETEGQGIRIEGRG